MIIGVRAAKVVFLLLLFLSIAAVGIAAFEGDSNPIYSVLDRAFYLTATDAIWIRPGLNLNLISVTIPASRKPVVTFRITDDKGQGLDREGKLTPGTVGLSFIMAYIPQNATQYVAYTTRTATSPITGVTAVQAGSDSGGSYTSLGDGNYTYTFNTTLPASYDTAATHTLGIYGSRSLAEFGLSRYRVNVTRNFVPNGSPVTKIREVAKTASCNACHDILMAHGETGREAMEICILCHTPQTPDPDTGNTMDMKVMIHKIHRGAGLPSVVAGKPYVIIGNRQSVHDYSTVAFPMDIRNCTACHKDAQQVNNWLLNPTRDACGSCHDDIDWVKGTNHKAGAQADDKRCAECHKPQGEFEYDASISGAHIPPYKSGQLRNPKVEIVSVTNIGPGLKPTVKFKLTDKFGKAVKPSEMTRLTLRFAGPTTDYRWNGSEAALTAAVGADDVSTYTFTTFALPADAKGTVALEVEGYITVNLNPNTPKQISQRDTMDNVVKYYAVTDKTAVPRRAVVETARCVKCHDRLIFHGGNRRQVEACVVCHNPTLVDTRPAAKGAPESIDFKIMIHRLHTGEELNNDYSILGSTGTGVSFNEVRYPGDRRDCLQCHLPSTYLVPLPASATAVTWPHNYWSPVLPTAAACLGCHDSVESAAHAFINTTAFGESCIVCHSEDADFGVGKSHSR